MKAAGTTGTIGPNLDEELTADPPSAVRESTVDPNKEIATGYSANIMPKNYGAALTKQQLNALVNYIYHSTNTKAKRATTTSTHSLAAIRPPLGSRRSPTGQRSETGSAAQCSFPSGRLWRRGNRARWPGGSAHALMIGVLPRPIGAFPR
jgi:hypothetical protein